MSPSEFVRNQMKADEHMAAADYKLPVIYPMKFYKMHGFSIPKDSGKR